MVPAGGMGYRPYPIVMQRGITRLTGHMFLTPVRLYFICQSQAGGLAVALGRGLGGLAGAAIASLAAPIPGQAAPAFDENMLMHAVTVQQGSLVMEPARISKIKCTIWWRGIWFDGKTYALPDGLARDLKRELGLWCHANNVKNAGLT